MLFFEICIHFLRADMTEKENSEQDTSLEKLAFKLLDHGLTFFVQYPFSSG